MHISNKQFDKMMVYLGVLIFIMLFFKLINGQGVYTVERNELIETRDNEEEKIKYKDLGENPDIHVLIMSEKFENMLHNELSFNGVNLILDNGEEIEKSNDITIKSGDDCFIGDSITIKTELENKIEITSIKRAYGTPKYHGVMKIYDTAEGLVLVNILPLETYLKGVLPSEMPASYEIEALKAQAVCARSYAYIQMQKYSYPEFEAHVNDSVDFQVYNNLAEASTCNRAIEETAGEKLGVGEEVVTTYFFSTSCGYTTNVEAWGTKLQESNQYLEGIQVWDGTEDYEKDLPWYRWKIEVDKDELSAIIELNLDAKLGTLKDVTILERGVGEVVLSIELLFDEESITIEGENAIRKALGSSSYEVLKNDNKTQSGINLLPSAFFDINIEDNVVCIYGGGLGHGIGMSQNGANEMAKRGMDYERILFTYYKNTEIII